MSATLPAGLVRAGAVGGILFLAGTSYLLQHRGAAGLLGAYLAAAPMLVGLIWSARRPGTPFAGLLVLLGFSGWLMSLESSGVPYVVAAGVLAQALALGVIVYILLGYPAGRLRSRFEKYLIAALAFGLIGFSARRVLPDSTFPTAATTVEVALVSVVAATVAGLVVWRLSTGIQQRRQALRFIAPAALLLLTAETLDMVFGTSGRADAGVIAALKFPLVAGFILLPLTFLVTLLEAEMFAGRTLRALVDELSKRPSLVAWRDTVAHALGDGSLRLELWDGDSRRFREAGQPPPSDSMRSTRQWVPVDRGRDPIAVLSVDERLAEDPELLRAASSATALAIESSHLESELRMSLARVAAAGDGERRRIARDLHDRAQQRLVTLRIHLSLAGEWLDRPEERVMIDDLGREVDEAMSELRDITHGFHPVVLSRYGIAAALRSASSSAAVPVRVEEDGLARHGEAIEHAVYFCCLEALQNVAKHGGKGVSAVVRLVEREDALCFEVDDDGVGFVPEAGARGAGLLNLADRLKAVGGVLVVHSSPGTGTRVRGRIPLCDDVPWTLPA